MPHFPLPERELEPQQGLVPVPVPELLIEQEPELGLEQVLGPGQEPEREQVPEPELQPGLAR